MGLGLGLGSFGSELGRGDFIGTLVLDTGRGGAVCGLSPAGGDVTF